MTEYKLYYSLQSPWIPTSYVVCVYGVVSRTLPISHIADSVGKTDVELEEICKTLKIHHAYEKMAYPKGYINVTNIHKLLRHLGWIEEDITKGVAMLSVKNGCVNRIGKTRRNANRPKKRATTEKKDNEDEDDDDEEYICLSPIVVEDEFDQDAFIEEMKLCMGPEGQESYQASDAYSALKQECVDRYLKENEQKIRDRARQLMEEEVRKELRKELEPEIRRLYQDKNVTERLQQREALRLQKEQKERSPPPRKDTELLNAFMNQDKNQEKK